MYSKGGGLFDKISGIYNKAKEVAQGAGITSIKAGDITIDTTRNITSPDIPTVSTPAVQIQAQTQIPDKFLYIGLGLLGLFLFLIVRK